MQQSDRQSADIKRETTHGLLDGKNTAVRSPLCRDNEKSRTVCKRGKMQQSDRHCAEIKRHHVQSVAGEECNSQIDILEISNDITYFL